MTGRRSRLKEYNPGAVIPLLPGELFRASWFPHSRGVHQVKILGDPAGAIEYAEYLILRGDSHFCHSLFTLASTDVDELGRALAALRQHAAPPAVDEDDEEPERRRITVWVGGEARAYYLVAPESCQGLGISPDLIAAFNRAWRAILQPVAARRRGLAGSEGDA